MDVLQLALATLFDLKSVAHKQSGSSSSRSDGHTASFSSWIFGHMGDLSHVLHLRVVFLALVEVLR